MKVKREGIQGGLLSRPWLGFEDLLLLVAIISIDRIHSSIVLGHILHIILQRKLFERRRRSHDNRLNYCCQSSTGLIRSAHCFMKSLSQLDKKIFGFEV